MMKTTTFAGVLVLATMAAGCATQGYRVESAAGEVSPSMVTTTAVTTVTPTTSTVPSDAAALTAYVDAGMRLSERVRVLGARVATIDRAPGVREFADLDLDAFLGVTDAGWLQMEVWSNGPQLTKLYLFPPNDRADTEELFFDQGRLVYVYWNPEGFTGGSQPGESFYFGDEGLISWVRDDGTRVDPMSPEFRYWDKQLRKEAARLTTIAHR